jgi:Tfp pilus assembly protein PilZ
MSPNESENRQCPRVKGCFLVSYRLGEKDEVIELSQINNLSEGGMAINTNIKFNPGTELILNLRIPLAPEPIKIVGRVVESREIDKIHFDTRIQFVTIEAKYRKSLIDTINHQLPADQPKKPQNRQHPRVKSRFIVSYRLAENDEIIDMSQISNLSQGGIAFKTNIKFNPGTELILNLRIPLAPEPVKIIGRVVGSSAVGNNHYDTRIQFVNIDEKYRKSLIDTIAHQLKKQ